MSQNGVIGFSHIAFNVKNLDQAVDFYCNGLGLEKAFEIIIPEQIKEEMPGHPMCELAGQVGIVYINMGNGNFLELFRPMPNADLTSGGANSDKMGFTHISIQVEDIKGYVEILRNKGITIDQEVSLGPDHTYQAWIKDPDGNRIELMEYTKESLQVIFGR